MLRPYQQNAHDAAIAWMRQSVAPCLIEAATGAGKSHIIAELAHTILRISGKRTLVLQPSAELTEQNRDKYLATGNPCSVMSASAGQKSLLHPVVFGTPGTVKGVKDKLGAQFALVIVDEAHKTTPTTRGIIDAIREANPNVRVVGLTATPYVLGDGYIYAQDVDGTVVEATRNPYYAKLVYRITAPELIAMGYLTPPRAGDTHAESYDTSGLERDRMGNFTAESVDRAYHGHGRKTAAIVADVIEQSRLRQGVMFFAATRQHAQEVMASLPPELSALVDGDTPKKERKRVVQMFKQKKLKYLVNVGVFTTGFDVPHVDVIALLRFTESVALLQQIIGRGLRLAAGKEDCLVLDYAGNIETHCPDGDIFAPVIRVKGSDAEAVPMKVKCPQCATINTVAARKNEEGYRYDEAGYFLDLEGQRVPTDFGDMPGHYGRRCGGMTYSPAHPLGVQCSYRWTSKDCPNCGEPNDIAARYCYKCKQEIVNPNDKLKLDFKRLKKNPYEMQVDVVESLRAIPTISRAGNPCLRLEIVTPYRSFTVWLREGSHPHKLYTEMEKMGIRTISYIKEPSGFYKILAYNQEEQKI